MREQKAKNKWKKIFVELLPLTFSLILLIFLRGEIEIIFIILLALFFTLKLSYKKGEFFFFLIGVFLGLIFEIIGNVLLGQKWAEASFFTIPIWLPISWGYGFIIIRRIGNIIIK